MATVIGEFVAKIGAETKAFDRGVDASRQKMKGFAGAFQRHAKAIRVAALVAGAAIFAMGVKSVKTFAKMGDEVQKMAMRTGFSTEALSELRFVAEQSGASLNMLEKAVRKQAKTILDATYGLTTYVRVFDKLGLKAEELIQMKPEEAFWKIASAVAEVENQQVRAAIASDLWGGRVGTMLLPMLEAGAQSIADLRQEANDLGIVFDQLSADQAAELTDALNTMKRATDGLAIEFGKTLGPSIKFLALSFADLFRAIRTGEWGMEASREFMKTFEKSTVVIEGLKVATAGLTAGTAELTAEQNRYSDAILESRRQMQGLLGLSIGRKERVGGGGLGGKSLTEILAQYQAVYGMTTGLAQFEADFGRGGSQVTPPGPPILDEFAHGGIVTKPTLAMIGEKGPEAVIPLEGDTVPIETTITTQLIVDGKLLAEVVNKVQGEGLLRRNRLGG